MLLAVEATTKNHRRAETIDIMSVYGDNKHETT